MRPKSDPHTTRSQKARPNPGPAAARSGGGGGGAGVDVDVGAAPHVQAILRKHLRAGGEGSRSAICAPCVPPLMRVAPGMHMCQASDYARAPGQTCTAVSGQEKSLLRAAQDAPLMVPGMQTASDQRRFPIGVSRAAWHTKALEGSLQRQSAEWKGGLRDGSSGQG